VPPPKRFEEVPNFTAVLGLICVCLDQLQSSIVQSLVPQHWIYFMRDLVEG